MRKVRSLDSGHPVELAAPTGWTPLLPVIPLETARGRTDILDHRQPMAPRAMNLARPSD